MVRGRWAVMVWRWPGGVPVECRSHGVPVRYERAEAERVAAQCRAWARYMVDAPHYFAAEVRS